MLDKGSGTAWELFAGFEGMAGWWTRSWCHAWSAYPAYLLPAYALGIRPLAVGFTHALIAPQLCDLAWVEGRVPTPHGPISLRAEQSALAWLAQITLPPGVSGEVHVPAGDILPLVTGAKAQIERAGAEYVIQLPPGAEVRIECARAAVSIRA